MYCWAYARGRDGKFILRIEDTDRRRVSDQATGGFMADLKWLGLGWDEGPEFEGCGGGKNGPYAQSERREIYDRYLQMLLEEGKAYYAFETPEELQTQRDAARAEKRNFKYDRASLKLSPEQVKQYLDDGRPAVIRFKTPDDTDIVIKDEVLGETTIPAGETDDFVIRKADGFPTYHFAVVVDDELMGVSHILRAQEHFKNTAKHMLLQDALGFQRPTYAHLGVIANPDGSKMSKRDKDKLLRKTVRDLKLQDPPEDTVDPDTFKTWLSDKNIQLDLSDAETLAAALDVHLPEIDVDDFKRSGYLPEVMCNFLALNGWSPGNDIEKFSLDFLTRTFDFDRVMKAPARFDRNKLLAFNLDAIQAMDVEDFVTRFRAHCEAYHPEFIRQLSPEQFDALAAANHDRSKTLEDPIESCRFFLVNAGQIEYADTKPVRKAMKNGLSHLEAIRPVLAEIDTFTNETVEEALRAYVDEHADGKLGVIAQPLRVAASGTTVSPQIYVTLTILGREEVLRRIDRCVAHFGQPV